MNRCPITTVTVMLPSGNKMTLFINSEGKRVEIQGARFGPLSFTREEAAALQDLLNLAYPVQ